MLKDATPQKKIERQAILDAIESLRAKGWDINPYTVADEAKIARSALYRNSEFMELLNSSRSQPDFKEGAQQSAGEGAAESESIDAEARLSELERRNSELQEMVAQLKSEKELLIQRHQESWQDGYQEGYQEGLKQSASGISGATVSGAKYTDHSPHTDFAADTAHSSATGNSGEFADEELIHATARALESAIEDIEHKMPSDMDEIEAAEALSARDDEGVFCVEQGPDGWTSYTPKPENFRDAEDQAAQESDQPEHDSDGLLQAKEMIAARLYQQDAHGIEPAVQDGQTLLQDKEITNLQDEHAPAAHNEQTLTVQDEHAAEMQDEQPLFVRDEQSRQDERRPTASDEPMFSVPDEYASSEIDDLPPAMRDEPGLSADDQESMAAHGRDQEEVPAGQFLQADPAAAHLLEQPQAAEHFEEQSQPTAQFEQEAQATGQDDEEGAGFGFRDPGYINDAWLADVEEDLQPVHPPEGGRPVEPAAELPEDFQPIDMPIDSLIAEPYIEAQPAETAGQEAAAEEAESDEAAEEPISQDELQSLLNKRFGKLDPQAKPEDTTRKAAGTKFVGGSRQAQEPPPQGFVMRTVPPDIRKACLVLGLRPEELTFERVHAAWKKEITNPGSHPDIGGDTEIAVYLNTAKDQLYNWLEMQAPKLGKKFGAAKDITRPPGKPPGEQDGEKRAPQEK